MSVRDLLEKAAPPPKEPSDVPNPTGWRQRIARAKARPKKAMTLEVGFGDAVATDTSRKRSSATGLDRVGG